ncbi:MAG: biotin--[acetyl-CoA-carboxylase] ligase [Acetobacteraceae bacterium]|nr:biotin--[acetyl-CoA-carboxylase] ligase [Acetobacteraceae bacterium]
MIEYEVRHYTSLDSTNDEAQRLAAAGAPHGTVVHADQQTRGRGRLSRRWVSPPGNLYLSIIVRPDLPLPRSAELGFLAALAVADAVDAMLPAQERAILKWPNDVLVRNGKIAGILLEQADDALVLGIGVNVLLAPGGVLHNVTTIVGCGGLATIEGVRSRVLASLAAWLDVWRQDGFAPIRSAWLARAHPVGTPLRTTVGENTVAGRFVDLAPDGALIMDTTAGRERFVAGDVTLSS